MWRLLLWIRKTVRETSLVYLPFSIYLFLLLDYYYYYDEDYYYYYYYYYDDDDDDDDDDYYYYYYYYCYSWNIEICMQSNVNKV